MPELGWFVAQKRKQELEIDQRKKALKKSATIQRIFVSPKAVAT